MQTKHLTKSYKLVVLRALLARDALWGGKEIPRLAVACLMFAENYPALNCVLALLTGGFAKYRLANYIRARLSLDYRWFS
jgi:hypothetical protein